METSTGLTGGDILPSSSMCLSGLCGRCHRCCVCHYQLSPGRSGGKERIGRSASRAWPTPSSGRTSPCPGDIDFDHVTFRYEGAAEPPERHHPFREKGTQRAAIIGGTGSGAGRWCSPVGAFVCPPPGRFAWTECPPRTLSRHHAGQYQLRAAKRDHLFRHRPGQCAHGQTGKRGTWRSGKRWRSRRPENS